MMLVRLMMLSAVSLSRSCIGGLFTITTLMDESSAEVSNMVDRSTVLAIPRFFVTPRPIRPNYDNMA